MTLKKLIAVAIIVGFAAEALFANGVQDNDGGRDGFHGEPSYFRHGEKPEVETFTGTFDFEDERYPVLETAGGERYYLLVRYPVASENIPEVDSDLTVEAFRTPMSPIHLMVLSAEVDGQTVEADWADFRGASGRGGRRRGGPWDGRHGHCWGWDGGGRGGFFPNSEDDIR